MWTHGDGMHQSASYGTGPVSFASAHEAKRAEPLSGLFVQACLCCVRESLPGSLFQSRLIILFCCLHLAHTLALRSSCLPSCVCCKSLPHCLAFLCFLHLGG